MLATPGVKYGIGANPYAFRTIQLATVPKNVAWMWVSHPWKKERKQNANLKGCTCKKKRTEFLHLVSGKI